MMSPEDEQKMEIGQAMGKSFMLVLFGIALALAEDEEARLVGVGIAVLAGLWFFVSFRRLMALRGCLKSHEASLRIINRIMAT
jgi:hypothetical protein